MVKESLLGESRIIQHPAQKISAKKLQGILWKGNFAQLVQLCAVDEQPQADAILAAIQSVLDSNKDLFREPTSLPPKRVFDHQIDLLPGKKPVNIKPYRYSPTQKDEIERQITEMLKNGVIQPSTSPFASPVLLVKKKDGSWCFCIDYKHLNAITIKNKYPLPIVDELLDELHGGEMVHQIRFMIRLPPN